jgi:CRISPR/Cas system-associated protein Csm6
MANVIEIELPVTTDPEAAQALAAEARKLSDVRSSDVSKPRIVDPASLIVWVKLAGATFSALSALVTLIRSRKIQKARIKVGDRSIEVDSASPVQIEALLAALEKGKSDQD